MAAWQFGHTGLRSAIGLVVPVGPGERHAPRLLVSERARSDRVGLVRLRLAKALASKWIDVLPDIRERGGGHIYDSPAKNLTDGGGASRMEVSCHTRHFRVGWNLYLAVLTPATTFLFEDQPYRFHGAGIIPRGGGAWSFAEAVRGR